MDNMYDTLVEILTQHLGVPEDEVDPDSTVETLEVDSLMIAELSVHVEERIGKPIPEDARISGATTLKELAELLQDLADEVD